MVDYGFEQDTMYDIDWVVGMQCKAHSCSNALKWGMQGEIDISRVEGAHIVIQSLIRTSSGIHPRMDLFLQRYLDFRDMTEDKSELTDFWAFFDVLDPDLPLLFVEVSPAWTGDRLFVRASLMNDPECFSKVSTVLAHTWRWRSWSDTRWVQAGSCARRYLKILFCGIEGQVQLCLADDTCSIYHPGGHKRSNIDIKSWFAMCSVCAVPTERLLLELRQDDLLLRRAQNLLSTDQAAMHEITPLPSYLWGRLTAIIGGGTEASDIKHLACIAASTALGYLHRDVFEELTHDPLAVTQGDIMTNLARLETRETTEPTTKKMQNLVLADMPRERLAAALQLLRDAPAQCR